jgi:predicted DNA-binding transcriptional regulator AlpA
MNVLLNTRQAAERCGLSARTLEKYRITGGGPPFIRLGGAVRYQLEDLDAWIASNRRRSTSDDQGLPPGNGGDAPRRGYRRPRRDDDTAGPDDRDRPEP